MNVAFIRFSSKGYVAWRFYSLEHVAWQRSLLHGSPVQLRKFFSIKISPLCKHFFKKHQSNWRFHFFRKKRAIKMGIRAISKRAFFWFFGNNGHFQNGHFLKKWKTGISQTAIFWKSHLETGIFQISKRGKKKPMLLVVKIRFFLICS